MDTLNITIDGHLGMPGLSRVRVPPPFGTPRDVIQAIESRRAKALSDEVLDALAVGNQAVVRGWRRHPRLTLIAIGVACTIVAALVGSRTGQRRQPLPQIEHAPATMAAQETPAAPVKSLDDADALMASRRSDGVVTPAQPDTPAPFVAAAVMAPVSPATVAVPAPVAAPVAQVPAAESAAPARSAPAAKPRLPARTSSHRAPHAGTRHLAPATPPMSHETETTIVRYMGTPPATAYVAPSVPAVTIQLQRHTRLTD